jgi:hypothetical protein
MNFKPLTLLFTLFLSAFGLAQNTPFKLTNAVVVAQQDKPEDRYSLEVNILQLLNNYGVKTKASLNLVKQGGSPQILSSDSIQKALTVEGFDTFMLISVRGYDKKFKPSEKLLKMPEELDAGHLFSMYRESASSVTFTITFYQNNIPVHYELIRTGNIGSREAVIKKLMKRMEKRLQKAWI